MVIGNYTAYIRVLVPHLLSASFRRELVGGSLCSKGAERSGSATIEKYRSLGLLFSSKSSSEEDRVFLSVCKSSNGESRGLSVYKLKFNDVFRVFDVEGWACDLFMLGLGHQQHPKEASSRGKRSPGTR